MTDDLIAFVTARLDKDEAAAKAATPGPWNASMEDILSLSGDPHWAGACAANASGDDATHIARHDPARVLREVAAKRAILAEHSPHYPVTYPQPSGQPTCTVCDQGSFDREPVDWPCPTVRHLAAAWSDHPDYRQEWALTPEARRSAGSS